MAVSRVNIETAPLIMSIKQQQKKSPNITPFASAVSPRAGTGSIAGTGDSFQHGQRQGSSGLGGQDGSQSPWSIEEPSLPKLPQMSAPNHAAGSSRAA